MAPNDFFNGLLARRCLPAPTQADVGMPQRPASPPSYPGAVSSAGDNEALARLESVLHERQASVAPLLAAVSSSGTSDALLAASALCRRIDLLLPFQNDALAAVAPALLPPAPLARQMLRVYADGSALRAARVIAGVSEPGVAVAELAAAPAAAVWLPIVQTLCDRGGKINARTELLSEPRGAIGVRFGARSAADDVRLVQEVAHLAGRLGLTEAQCALWQRLHATIGEDVSVVVTTQCTPTGPTPRLGFTYATRSFDRAVELARAMLDLEAARRAAASLGRLAGLLESERMMAVEVVFAAQGPDLIAWTKLRSE